MPIKKYLKLAACLLLVANFSQVQAKKTPFEVKAYYDKAEYMIPMRDGVKLFTIVYTPKDKSQKYSGGNFTALGLSRIRLIFLSNSNN